MCKRFLFSALLPGLLLAATGCAQLHYRVTKVDGSKVELNATTAFSNSTLAGLMVDNTTKTSSTGLKLKSSSSEPNPDSITATGTAMGDLVGGILSKVAGKP